MYRVVIADVRRARNGRIVENIGFYHPQAIPAKASIDEERALYWLGKGAEPTERVRRLLKEQGVLAKVNKSAESPKE
jgi:small subunit ribosomal protein S16